MRLLKWLVIVLVARCGLGAVTADDLRLGPYEKTSPHELSVPIGDEPFDVHDALHGSYSSPEQCAGVPDGLWVEVEGKGDCIRYYADGLAGGANLSVLVFFGGDVMLRTSKGIRFISASYSQQSPASLQSEMAEWSAQARHPAIYLARPGMFGSSGDHNMRRRPREIALMDAALDQIKARYDVSAFILAGQSGGGQIVASLLNRRTDVSAAVISSGLLSVTRALRYWKLRDMIPGKDLYNARKIYDPIDEIDRIRKDPPPEIYVISDPEDNTVPFFTQLHYVRRLRVAGFKVRHVYAHAPDRQHHVLVPYARLAAAMIARGKGPKDVIKALDKLELDQLQ